MIVDMKKLLIVGLKSERRAVLQELQRLGMVQLEEVTLTDEEREKVLEMTQIEDVTHNIERFDDEISRVSATIAFLDDLSGKKPSENKQMKYQEFVERDTYRHAWSTVEQISALRAKIGETKTKINSFDVHIQNLSPWENLQTNLEFTGTKSTKFIKGTLPLTANIDEIRENLDQIEECSFEVINVDKTQRYVTLLAHNSVLDQAANILKNRGFLQIDHPNMTRTIAYHIAKAEKDAEKERVKFTGLQKQVQEMTSELPNIRALLDSLNNLKERGEARKLLLTTDSAFLVGGWIKASEFAKFKETIEDKYAVAVSAESHADEEQPPVVFKNSKLVTPFELVTNMFSLPGPDDLDPNAVMGFFYFVLFGMMMADAGYGLIMLIGGLIAMRKYKLEGGGLQLAQIITICGISTFFWGVMFGGWLGNIFPLLLDNTNIPKFWRPILFDPLQDPMRLLILSILIGFVHILAGLALKAYNLIRHGKLFDAIFDVGFWYATLIGLGLLFLPSTAQTGKWLAIGGIVGLILTQGREKKNIIAKLLSGVLSLYDITGYFSDLLSYSRVLALGLAAGVISTVVNTMATLPGQSSIIGIISLILITSLGHIFNLVLGLVGAYVHTSRLQYIEFFGKFYDGGGRPFRPFKVKSKYITLKD